MVYTLKRKIVVVGVIFLDGEAKNLVFDVVDRVVRGMPESIASWVTDIVGDVIPIIFLDILIDGGIFSKELFIVAL